MPLASSQRQCFVCSGAPKPSCYRNNHVKLCEKCRSMFAGNRDECPYCVLPTDRYRPTPTMRIRKSQSPRRETKRLSVTAKMVFADGPDRTMTMAEVGSQAAESSSSVEESSEESGVEEQDGHLIDEEPAQDDSNGLVDEQVVSSVEVVPVDDESADDDSADEGSVEEEPANEEPVEEESLDEEPVDDEPVEEESVEEEPINDAPIEEESVEKAPADEEPADEDPVEEEPVQEPVEEAPAEEAPAEESSIEEAPVEMVPAEVAPAQSSLRAKLAGLTLEIPDREISLQQDSNDNEVEVFPDTPEDAVPEFEKQLEELSKPREEREKAASKPVKTPTFPIKKGGAQGRIVRKGVTSRSQTPEAPSCRRCSLHGKHDKCPEQKPKVPRGPLVRGKSVREERPIKQQAQEEPNETLGECF
ncbi:hypothetical protein P170DRAFT_420837 [Aspergillus steynii IBT 23096]|uniref:Uncharacterized protein n=1 Tax=Aspergillus steynii IBT 23096 TaxID=1392250 RepID=A0A2I2GME6_9EURO|nr:uncharacterized protein P170DRAFT_420837 [Aspergillus steynii IBT 23096]PLB54058.1 hypothetical protein P170DRAFT_420837 [Aspergillus steynii IBT 23096]